MGSNPAADAIGTFADRAISGVEGGAQVSLGLALVLVGVLVIVAASPAGRAAARGARRGAGIAGQAAKVAAVL